MRETARSKPELTESLPPPDRSHQFQALYVRHWAELCNYVRKRFGAGPPDPEDIAQEAFMRFTSLENVEEIANARAYLYRTAHNIVVDERRRQSSRTNAVRTEEHSTDPSDDRTPERVILERERLDGLARVIRAMPAPRRRSLLLNRLHGMSCAAIARMTGYSESAVKKHITLALIDLEAEFTAAESTGRNAR